MTFFTFFDCSKITHVIGAFFMAVIAAFFGAAPAAQAIPVGFGDTFVTNPVVVAGTTNPVEVFVTKLGDETQSGMNFRFILGQGPYTPTVVLTGTDPLETTGSRFVGPGPVLFDVTCGSLCGSGGVTPTGGTFGPFTWSFEVMDLDNPVAAILGVKLSGNTLAWFGMGIGDTYADLTAVDPPPGGGTDPAGVNAVPLPAPALLLLVGLAGLSLIARRKRVI